MTTAQTKEPGATKLTDQKLDEASIREKADAKTERLVEGRILAIDIGGTGLKAAVLSSDGDMLTERIRVATPHPVTPEGLVDALVNLVESGVLTQEWVDDYLKSVQGQQQGEGSSSSVTEKTA